MAAAIGVATSSGRPVVSQCASALASATAAGPRPESSNWSSVPSSASAPNSRSSGSSAASSAAASRRRARAAPGSPAPGRCRRGTAPRPARRTAPPPAYPPDGGARGAVRAPAGGQGVRATDSRSAPPRSAIRRLTAAAPVRRAGAAAGGSPPAPSRPRPGAAPAARPAARPRRHPARPSARPAARAAPAPRRQPGQRQPSLLAGGQHPGRQLGQWRQAERRQRRLGIAAPEPGEEAQVLPRRQRRLQRILVREVAQPRRHAPRGRPARPRRPTAAVPPRPASSPASSRSRVDFPAPLAPTSSSAPPRSSRKDNPAKTTRSPRRQAEVPRLRAFPSQAPLRSDRPRGRRRPAMLKTRPVMRRDGARSGRGYPDHADDRAGHPEDPPHPHGGRQDLSITSACPRRRRRSAISPGCPSA